MRTNSTARSARKSSVGICVAVLAATTASYPSDSLLADQGKPHEALVLICPRDDLAGCTIATARIFFRVRVESAVPSGCLALAMAKAAEVSDLLSKEEAPKITCGR